MGILAELRETQGDKRPGGNRCRMCTLADPDDSPLGPDDAFELAEALADPGIFASTLIQVLKGRAHEVTNAMIGNHRRQHVDGWTG